MARAVLLLLLGMAAVADALGDARDPEYDVAMTALADRLAPYAHPDSVRVFRDLSWFRPYNQSFDAWVTELWPRQFRPRAAPAVEFLRSFWDANEHKRRLARAQTPDGHVVQLTKKHQPDLPPGISLITLSRVGFAPTLDSALVALTFECPGLCGGQDLYLYVRKEGGWTRTMTVSSIEY